MFHLYAIYEVQLAWLARILGVRFLLISGRRSSWLLRSKAGLFQLKSFVPDQMHKVVPPASDLLSGYHLLLRSLSS